MASQQDKLTEWGRLYRQHKNHVLTAAAHLVGGRRDVAEDVLHDVFITLCERHAPDEIENPRVFLVTACLNRARDWLRREGIRQACPVASEVVDSGPPAADQAELNEVYNQLSEGLSSLPDSQREIVVLHIYGQLTFREIGDHISISVNTAKSRYRYALKLLRQRLQLERRSP